MSRYLSFLESLTVLLGILLTGTLLRSIVANIWTENKIILALNSIGLILGLQAAVTFGRWRALNDKSNR